MGWAKSSSRGQLRTVSFHTILLAQRRCGKRDQLHDSCGPCPRGLARLNGTSREEQPRRTVAKNSYSKLEVEYGISRLDEIREANVIEVVRQHGVISKYAFNG